VLFTDIFTVAFLLSKVIFMGLWLSLAPEKTGITEANITNIVTSRDILFITEEEMTPTFK
jgi:hypothetical protein